MRCCADRSAASCCTSVCCAPSRTSRSVASERSAATWARERASSRVKLLNRLYERRTPKLLEYATASPFRPYDCEAGTPFRLYVRSTDGRYDVRDERIAARADSSC